jgi:small nuclear ribonucleoprotein (snRNP)-like protein
MNVVLNEVDEFEKGEFKSRYNEVFIRGNNVFYIGADLS